MSEQNQNPSNKETLEAIEKFKRSKKNPNVDKSSVISDQPVMQQQKIQQMYDPQQQRETDPDLIAGYEIVKLPSKGLFYKNGISEAEVFYLTTSDEDLLTTPSLLQNETVLDVLLRRKIKTKGINIDELLSGDKDALLLFLRMSSYGPEYQVNVINPETGIPFKTTVDLRKLTYKEITEMPDVNGLFSVDLPMRKKWIKFRLLTATEEKNIRKAAEIYQQELNQEFALYNTNKLKASIVEVEGKIDRSWISKFVDALPALDSYTIRRKYMDISPGLNMNYEFKTPQNISFIAQLQIGSDFFFPQR